MVVNTKNLETVLENMASLADGEIKVDGKVVYSGPEYKDKVRELVVKQGEVDMEVSALLNQTGGLLDISIKS